MKDCKNCKYCSGFGNAFDHHLYTSAICVNINVCKTNEEKPFYPGVHPILNSAATMFPQIASICKFYKGREEEENEGL